MFKRLYEILTKPWYAVLAVLTSFIIFTVSVLLPNFALIWQIFANSSYALYKKFLFLFSLYGSIQTNFSVLSASYTILIAILFGINIALFVFYIKGQRRLASKTKSNIGTGVGGVVSGFLGVGCASCGTFILSGILSMFGATAIIALLPLGGAEFGILGVLLLAYSIYSLLKKLQHPYLCD